MNEPLTPPDSPDYEYVKIAGVTYIIYHNEYISDDDLNNVDEYILYGYEIGNVDDHIYIKYDEDPKLITFGHHWNGHYMVKDINTDEVLLCPDDVKIYEAKIYDPCDHFDV